MSIDKLNSLLNNSSVRRLAVFPDTSNRSEIVRTACAFANTEGGEIVVGAMPVIGPSTEPRYEIIGIAIDSDEETAVLSIGTYLKPQHSLLVEKHPVHQDRVVCIIHVPEKKPGTTCRADDGLAWRRIDGRNEVDISADNNRNVKPSVVAKMASILANGPSETVEFVEDPLSAKFATTICAFANTKGGVIYVGVKDSLLKELRAFSADAEILRRTLVGAPSKELQVGLALVKNTLDPFPKFVKKNFLPSVSNPNRWVVEVRVFPSDAGAIRYRTDGAVYIRVGSATEKFWSDTSTDSHYLKAKSSKSGGMEIVGPDLISALQGDPSVPELSLNSDLVLDEAPTATDAAPRSTHTVGAMLSIRREAEESEESLNCEEHAKVLSAFFAQSLDDVCFGLFGHWGRGKTYLTNRISQILQASSGYNVVRFSAWKYRSTPEVWAHLYETVATVSRAADFMMKILAPYRSMLARYGIWPIIFSYVSFGFSLYALDEKLWFAQVTLQLLGLSGICYFLVLCFRLHGIARGPAGVYLKQPSHREKLGLQAAIGDDLRALLIGWAPKDYWLPYGDQRMPTTWWKQLASGGKKLSSVHRAFVSPRTWWDSLKTWPTCFKKQVTSIRESVVALALRVVSRRIEFGCDLFFIVIYLVATAFVYSQLVAEEAKTVRIPFYGNLDTATPQSFVNVVYALWTLFAVILPGLAFVLWQGPRRLLLVVDDLDRCEPVQMLEIIESIMLLLDDKEIQRRLQIVMLVEEEALYAALLRKYDHLRLKNAEDSKFEASTDSRIVRENIEKIFVSYLRLPEIPTDDFRDLLSKYLHASDGEPEATDVDDAGNFPTALPSAIVQTNTSTGDPVDVSNSDSDTGIDEDKAPENMLQNEDSRSTQPPAKSKIEYAPNLKLSGRERRLLQARLEAFRASERTDIRWGPRTVRCYIHKYRLARELWIALKPGGDFDTEALLDALIPLQSSQTGSDDHLLNYVVAQVS